VNAAPPSAARPDRERVDAIGGMEQVWRERANRLSRRPVASEAGPHASPVMVLGIGKERYGIDLPDVAEVLPAVRPTPVPGAAEVFSGVINVHGEIRPVLDLRRWLGMEIERTGDALPRVIVLRRNGSEMGLQIDSVEHIRWVGPGDLQPTGSGTDGCSRRVTRRLIRRTTGSTEDLLLLLSTDALFAELQTAELQTAELQTAELQTAELQIAELQTAELQTAESQRVELQTLELPAPELLTGATT
jgi:chemotaxis signal transduction protein